MSTIYALSTGRGRAGIAVVRVSGPGAGVALETLADRRPKPREATAARIGAADGSLIDRGLVLWFPAPASATGEDVAEFHVHGGAAVVDAVGLALSAIPGLRTAEAGEFTRRAFRNGKLDLTQVEAVADLIAAETEVQRRQAARQLDGELGRMLDHWRAEALRALAHIEAAIDFADEEHPADAAAGASARVRRLLPQMDEALAGAALGERLRTGIHAALVGAPNVGKSSLLNRLARRDAAIVAETAGTTRDVVEVHLDLAGIPLILADTAGLRTGAQEDVEREGVRRAEARAASADLRIAVFDGGAWPALDPRTEALVDEHTVVAVNKADLMDTVPAAAEVAGQPGVFVSATTGAGLTELVAELERKAEAGAAPGEVPALTRGRHREALARAVEHLRRFLAAEDAVALELRAEDLRLAARELGRITGQVDVDEMLDMVFADFCIGK